MQPRSVVFGVCGLVVHGGRAAATTIAEVAAQSLEARGGEDVSRP